MFDFGALKSGLPVGAAPRLFRIAVYFKFFWGVRNAVIG